MFGGFEPMDFPKLVIATLESDVSNAWKFLKVSNRSSWFWMSCGVN